MERGEELNMGNRNLKLALGRDDKRTDAITGISRWPDFYIVGAPKAGTTSLYEYLRQHPHIYFSPIKETHFFGSDLIWRKRVVTRDTALSSYLDAPSGKLLGDASVFYLMSKYAAEEIYEANPNARIIAIVRNPLTLVPSLHQQSIRTGDETQRTLASAMEMEAERKAGIIDVSRDNPGVMQQLYYSEIARYSEQLSRYFEVFGRDRVLVIEFDAFVKDPATTVSTVFEFLGVSEIATKTERHNEAKSPRSWLLWQYYRHPFGPLRKLWRGALPDRSRRYILLWIERVLFKKEKLAVTPADRRRIALLYDSELARLEVTAGLDLTSWREDFKAALSSTMHSHRDGEVL